MSQFGKNHIVSKLREAPDSAVIVYVISTGHREREGNLTLDVQTESLSMTKGELRERLKEGQKFEYRNILQLRFGGKVYVLP